MTRRPVTRPMQAMSKSKVDEMQRQLSSEAIALALTAKELAAMSKRLMAVWQAMQNAQSR